MVRSLARILAAASLVMLAAGCGDSRENQISVAVIGAEQPAIVEPSDGELAPPEKVMLASVAQGLVRFDARGQIEPGLAESWNVSADGLSYIFRLTLGNWPDGRKITARDVARILSRQLRPASRNALKDTLGAVAEVVAMTDRVIEIRLRSPRPNLLQLLAQPEFAVVREGQGTGPFQIAEPAEEPEPGGGVVLSRRVRVLDEPDWTEQVALRSAPAAEAIGDFKAGRVGVVLGGSFVDLPLARRAELKEDAIRFDPVAGLFGLVAARRAGPLAEPELRSLLTRAIDRDALVAALGVPGLVPRATVLQGGLEGLGVPAAPAWTALPLAERRPRLAAEALALFGDEEPPQLAVALPEGPGADIVFNRLRADWAPLGIDLVRAEKGVAVDLRLIDRVAPSTSPAWFVRNFRCGEVPICSEEADAIMDSARDATVAAQRAALIAQAAELIDGGTLFIPLAAPVRWSLVADGIDGFAENIFARHPLTGLGQKLSRERR